MRALGVVLALLAATPVQAGWLLAEACPRAGAVELLLLPEDRDALDAAPAGAVTVTGGYTATDRRDGDRPKPVGLHLRRGEAVNREFGRMEGLLLVPADAPPAIHAVDDVHHGESRHDLRTLAARRRFVASAEGASALQSHLLIRDGRLDLRDVEDAPRAVRRLLLQGADGGLSIWQGSSAQTLYEAALEARDERAPAMALNLDMGSFDFCERMDAGRPVPCGALRREGLGPVSNLLRLAPGGDCL